MALWPVCFTFASAGRPSNELLVSTMLGNVVSTLLALYAFPEPLDGQEVAIIWSFDILALLAVDLSFLGLSRFHFCA